MLWIRIETNADPIQIQEPKPMRIHADLDMDPDPEQTLKSQNNLIFT